MFDLTAMGELLVDFTFIGHSENKMRLFEQNPGGAPANVVCAASKLGLHTAFIGKIGMDMHGMFLKTVLEENNVDVKGLISDPKVFTTLAFVQLAENGERSFSFARKPGADTTLRTDELDMDIILESHVFHVGSLSLTDEPARSATMYALKHAREAGVIISYDPNYRELLWSGKEEAERQMRSIIPYADIIKLSDEETDLLTGYNDPQRASAELLGAGVSMVIVTLGAAGALVATCKGTIFIPATDDKPVDTTGAGDAFLGGFLYKLVTEKLHPKEITLESAAKYAAFAHKVAGICVGRRGAINAMPTLSEIK